MIDTVLNLLFRCSHRRLSRPLAAVPKMGVRSEAPYIVCLDCGKRFAYDDVAMKIGKALDTPGQDTPKTPPQARRVMPHPSRRSS